MQFPALWNYKCITQQYSEERIFVDDPRDVVQPLNRIMLTPIKAATSAQAAWFIRQFLQKIFQRQSVVQINYCNNSGVDSSDQMV